MTRPCSRPGRPFCAPAGTTPRPTACASDSPCLTCGDVAVPVTVVGPAAGGGFDMLCRDDAGRFETVATELVGPLGAGDRLLVHAGVAIEVVGRAAGLTRESGGRDAVRR